ncbi:MAG: transposase, partial [Ruminococcus sp.]|nr:transposase [Ruminococcus sp.]
KSGVLVGWNITDSPDSQSTLIALRFAMLRFGVPEYLYFDTGREFVTYDIVGELTHRHISDKKKGNTPKTILEHLGIKVVIAIPTNAQAKVVERIHRTIKEQFCRSERGFCGGNVLERAESLKRRIRNGDIEAESELFKNFSDYADNVFNVAEYGGSEAKYKGMSKIDVWNSSIADITQRTASEGVLDLLLMRTKGYQKIKKNGVFVNYHGEKVWYYDEQITWQHIGEEVCVKYDPNNKGTVRLYDRDDRYLYTWKVADWMFTEYVGEDSEKLAEIGRKKSHVRRDMIQLRQQIIGDDFRCTQQDGLEYIAGKNKGKFRIKMSKNIIPLTVSEELPKAVNDINTKIPVSIELITKNAELQKGR